jgi:hypothetical protein
LPHARQADARRRSSGTASIQNAHSTCLA